MHRTMLFPEMKKKAVTLSYDDGVDTDIELINIMNRYGLKGTFNINTGFFAKEPIEKVPGGPFHRRMTAENAYKLYEENGMEVAVHCVKHPYLEQLPINEVVSEVLDDRTAIERATGKICRGMAYPQGTTGAVVVEALKACGILYARTTESRLDFRIPEDWLRLSATCHHNNPRLMELADQFVNAQPTTAMMFYLWGHSYEFERDNNWNVIEEFAQKIGGHDDIWYATNSEIFEYIEAYKQLRSGDGGRILYNPTVKTLCFRFYDCGRDHNLSIAPGETMKIEEPIEI